MNSGDGRNSRGRNRSSNNIRIGSSNQRSGQRPPNNSSQMRPSRSISNPGPQPRSQGPEPRNPITHNIRGSYRRSFGNIFHRPMYLFSQVNLELHAGGHRPYINRTGSFNLGLTRPYNHNHIVPINRNINIIEGRHNMLLSNQSLSSLSNRVSHSQSDNTNNIDNSHGDNNSDNEIDR